MLGVPSAVGARARVAIEIAASPEPLYVLDGVPISPATTPMNTIDPNTVESIQPDGSLEIADSHRSRQTYDADGLRPVGAAVALPGLIDGDDRTAVWTPNLALTGTGVAEAVDRAFAGIVGGEGEFEILVVAI